MRKRGKAFFGLRIHVAIVDAHALRFIILGRENCFRGVLARIWIGEGDCVDTYEFVNLLLQILPLSERNRK